MTPLFGTWKRCCNCKRRIQAFWNRCPHCGVLAGRH